MCRHIKGDINTSHIPIVLLTARTDKDSKITALDAGADSYIEKPFSTSHLKAQLSNLLRKREMMLKNFTSDPMTEYTSFQGEQDKKFIDKCSTVILENIQDPEFSVNTLAAEMGMSRTSLFTKIKGLADMTPNDFIKLTRLKQASRLMAETDYRVTEIRFLVGFNSSSYFAKCFQKQFGILPAQFLKNIRNERQSD